MKSKQFGQGLKNMWNEEVMVTTIRQSQEVTVQLTLGLAATIVATIEDCFQPTLGVLIYKFLCGRNHVMIWPSLLPFLGLFWPTFRGVFKEFFHIFLSFEL